MVMKILICSDGSPQAERAIELGAVVAAGCQADVVLLGVAERDEDTAQLVEALGREKALLEGKGLNVQVVTRAGRPIPEIVKCTVQTAYDLVIIGSVRRRIRGRFWLSSNSYKLIREIGPPVLSVPGKTTAIARVLICSGGKEYIDRAVRLSGRIAHATGATATLLHVMPEAPAIYSGLPRMEITPEQLMASSSELGTNLRREKQTLESLGVKAEVKLRDGSVLGEILAEIRSGKYDLVVTGSALNRTLRTYVLGDVSREIVNRSNAAVLVVRSEEKPGLPGAGLRGWFGHRAGIDART
jgi:nucleotide-binding universal stress UspA family protein